MTAADGPYVGLECFHEEDAGLFFGRDAERTRIIGNLRASRLTLLHAESGVGKSSLLRAGVVARLRELTATGSAVRYVPLVFSGWDARPTQAVIDSLEAAARPLAGNGSLTLRNDTLRAAIEDASAATDATLLVILDQFEEHFLYEPEDEGGFDDQLSSCVVDRDLHAHFLISVREDAYASIGQRFKSRIPNVYGNYLHLDFLDEQAARYAIVEPVEAFSRGRSERFEIEPELVDAVLDGVRRGRVAMGDDAPPESAKGDVPRIETAYLQLVMKRIWDEELAAGSHVLRLETLRSLGGADTIVRAHLDDAMGGLTAEQRDAAADAFRFLITSGGRKIALTSRELGEFSQTSEESLEPALERLERQRILRPIPSPEQNGAVRRELYHDVLAPAVLDWRRRHLEERRAHALDRLGRRNRLLALAVITLLGVVAAMSLYMADPGWLRRLELRTVDARLSVRGEGTPDPRLRLIAVDDRTVARLDRDHDGLISRAAYARVLRIVGRDRPAVIALDVIFGSAREPRATRTLLGAIRSTRDRLVLPYGDGNIESVVQPDGSRVIGPVLFGHSGEVPVRTGYAGLPRDEDKRIRRANYEVDFGTAEVGASAKTFAFAAADIVRRGELTRRLGELPTASRTAWGGQNENATWIDFEGGPGDIPHTSLLDLLDGRVTPGAFRGKLVVIGVTSKQVPKPDVHSTPLDDATPGAEVQAAALSTMVRDMPLRDVGVPVDVVAVLLVAGLGASAVLWRSRILGILTVAAVAAGFLVAAQLAFGAGRIVAVVPPLCALALVVLGVAAFELVRSIRAR